jgi:hypothetical protein
MSLLRNLSLLSVAASALTLGLAFATSPASAQVTTESTFGGTQTYTGVAGHSGQVGPVQIEFGGNANAFAEQGTLWQNYLHGGAATGVVGQGSGLLTAPGSFKGSGVINATAETSAYNPVTYRFVDVGSNGSIVTSGQMTGTPNAVGFTETTGTFNSSACRTFTFDPVSASTTAGSQTGVVMNGPGSFSAGSSITTKAGAWTVGN